MANYTRNGLERLSRLITYCQENDQRFWDVRTHQPSNRRMAEFSKTNHTSIGRVKRAYKGFDPEEDRDPFDDYTLQYLTEVLWVPLSTGTDWVTGDDLPRVLLTFQDLRGIAEGGAIPRIHEAEPQSSFTTELERCRGRRKHSYKDLCEYCLIPTDFETVQRIRKLLLFGGWAADMRQATQDVLALGRYLADLDDAQPDEQGNLIYTAVKRLVDLQTESINQFALQMA